MGKCSVHWIVSQRFYSARYISRHSLNAKTTIIIIIIIKNEKIRVTLCENAAGALYIVNKMCVDGLRNVEGW